MVILQLLLLFQFIMSSSVAYNHLYVYGDLKDKFIQKGEFSHVLLTLMLMGSRVKLCFS